MGSSDLYEPVSATNSDLLADEKPQHLVNIQSFALGKFEVTQSEWNALMGTDPSLKNEYLRVKTFNKFNTSKLVFVPKSIIIGYGW